MTGHVLDLSRYNFKHIKGDVTIYGTWYGETLEESEPCLCLIPTYRRGVPCCIALSAAYKYDDPKYLLGASQGICHQLGFSDSMQNVSRVADLIYSYLPDLVKIPPKPSEGLIHVAEVTLTHESGRKKSIDLIEEI